MNKSKVSLMIALSLLTACTNTNKQEGKPDLSDKVKTASNEVTKEQPKEVKANKTVKIPEDAADKKADSGEIKKEETTNKKEVKDVKTETKDVKVETKVVKKETKEAPKQSQNENTFKKQPKTVAEMAKEVIAGKHGNGEVRRKALESLGYSFDEVQKEVEKLLPKKEDIKSEVQSGTKGEGQAEGQNLQQKEEKAPANNKPTKTPTVNKEESPAPKKEEPKVKAPKEAAAQPSASMKTLSQIADDVLAGKYGNGAERYAKLKSEGYNPDEVQDEVEKKLEAVKPKEVQKANSVKAESRSSSSSSSSDYSNMPNNSILIGGHILTISNVATQARIDAKYKEFVNWHSAVTPYKTVYDDQDYYLALHVDSWGWLVQQYGSFVFKDHQGNTRTYVKSKISPLFSYYQPDGNHGGGPGSDYSDMFWSDTVGNAIGIQTCLSGDDARYQIHTYVAQ